MANRKRRVRQHVMEDRSIEIVRRILPNEWVIRDYKPDYGIDMAVEVFDHIDTNTSIAETMGEWFFVQVKSITKTAIQKRKVYPRYNVEKRKFSEDEKNNYEGDVPKIEIDTIPYKIDTSLLLTVQSLGTAIPVFLFLVTLDTERMYFICLNDVIDKCIIPEDNDFSNKKTKTIHIPVKNEVSSDKRSLVPLKFIAKRPKLYSAFSKFTYQQHELGWLSEELALALSGSYSKQSSVNTIIHFLENIKRFDFWETTEMWPIIPITYQEVLEVEQLLHYYKRSSSRPDEKLLKQLPELLSLSKLIPISDMDQDLIGQFVSNRIQITWDRLKVLNNVYEEFCREWFLPTYLGDVASDYGGALPVGCKNPDETME